MFRLLRKKKFFLWLKYFFLNLSGSFWDHFAGPFWSIILYSVFFGVLKNTFFSCAKLPDRFRHEKSSKSPKKIFHCLPRPSLQFLCFNFWKKLIIFHFFLIFRKILINIFQNFWSKFSNFGKSKNIFLRKICISKKCFFQKYFCYVEPKFSKDSKNRT